MDKKSFSGKSWNSRSGVICAEKCRKMDSIRIFLKTALNKYFAIIGNLYETNGCLSSGSGAVFWKTLDLEFWIDF